MTDDTKRAAVYVSWTTFKNALEQLSKGMPSRIDRSVFTGTAWNVQNQLFAGLKFLGLVKGDDEPTTVLEDLVSGSEEERKLRLRKVIEDRYSELIAMDLTKVTKAHFEEKIGELYGVSGDTKERAGRFFVNAATYVGIPLSSFITPKDAGGNGSTRARASRPRPGKRTTPPPPPLTSFPGDSGSSTGTSKTVSLASGGTLTLSATLDLFALNTSDRKFVFDLIDKLEEYQKISS